MDFIMENYIWFSIAGVLILMAILGYIAEKTNFGKGNQVKKEEKKVKKEEVVIEQPTQEVSEVDLFNDMNVMPMDVNLPVADTNPVASMNEDLYAGLENYAPLTPEVAEEQTDINQDLYKKLEVVDLEKQQAEAQNLDELSQPLEPIAPVAAEQPTEIQEVEEQVEAVNEVEQTEIKDIETTTPDIFTNTVETPAEETQTAPVETEEENVWKF